VKEERRSNHIMYQQILLITKSHHVPTNFIDD